MRYDAIYLSPHLDDVALSCGGQVYDLTAAGQSVLIVTIAAGDPPESPLSDFALALHSRWQLAADAVARRREEDAAACQVLGADCLHWDIPDCIYRLHPQTGAPLYTSNEALFGKVNEAETAVAAQLADRMCTLPPHDRVIAPLTVGNHVDHQ
ncbi:MAG: PIG-L family deacetylase, partial [Anaerolineales bacterium]|nr:PIG-L family deacetylase [Anaerolineales bacterium]